MHRWIARAAPGGAHRELRGGGDAGRRTTAVVRHRLRRGGAREGVEEAAKSPPIGGAIAGGRPFRPYTKGRATPTRADAIENCHLAVDTWLLQQPL